MRIAVTGATGRIGGQIVRLLAAGRDHRVVALSRRPARTLAASADADSTYADYADPVSLRSALRDVDTLVFVSGDGEATKMLLHHQNVVRAAADSGVAHIVLLSSVDADLESPFCYAVVNGCTERLVRESGCSFSIARASIYTEFFLQWITGARAGGEIRLPAADGRISLVSRGDVSACLAALALAGPTGRHHDITGPESLGLAAIADTAEQEWGTPVRYAEVTRAEHCMEMAAAGEDPWWLFAYSTMLDSIREQRWDSVSDEVLHLTGRAPTSLRAVIAQHAMAARSHA